MKLKTLIHDMNVLERELQKFEEQFGVKSSEFYDSMINGELEEFDALDDHRMAFIEWLGLYKIWLSFADTYRQLILRQPVALQIRTAVLA